MLWGLGQPGSILADEGIGEDSKLSCDGDEGKLWWFSGGGHALVESFHVGIEAPCGEGGEIEDPTDVGATAPDDADTVALAGLVGDRRQAREHGDLLDGALAELGQAGEQGCSDNKADTGDRGQDGIAPGQAIIDLDALEDRRIERCDILVSALDI
jgi:hypothetical protein